MSTYFYRNARLQILTDALAVLADDPQNLRPVLEAEQAALQPNDWTVSDDTYLAVGLDWLWQARLRLKMMVDDDPAFAALGRTSLLTTVQAGAIETIPHNPSGPPPDYLDLVRASIDQDDTVLMELLHAGHRRWILEDAAQRAYPFDDVGVLLPLRLETLFDEPGSTFNDDPARWKLSLRVIPDEASISRDNPYVSDGEAGALVDFWQVVKQPDDVNDTWLEGDNAGAAWQRLCDRVTGPRAAWLVSTIVFHQDDDTVVLDLPVDMPTEAPPNRVSGIPPELLVFVINNGARQEIGRLPMDETEQIDTANLLLPLPANLDDEKMRWWANWNTAKTVGLAGEWLLPQGMTPQSLNALYVIGIGDETPEQHFKAQIDAGELGLLRLGAATNTIQGKAAADMGQNSPDWRTVAQMRLRQRLDPTQNPAMAAAQNIERSLTGDATLPFFPGADLADDDTRDSQRMVRALYPALWGHWLRDIWQSGDDMYRMAEWAFSNLCPEGALLPLRIDDQPYGLLPVTALSQWEAAPAFLPETQAQRQVEMNIAGAVTSLRSQWAQAVLATRSNVGKSTREFMQLLAQDGLSRDYIWRYLIPAWTVAGILPLAGGQPQEFLDRALEAYRPAMDFFNREPAGIFLLVDKPQFIGLPLVQPTRMTYRHQRHQRRERILLPELLTLLYEFPAEEPLDAYDIDKFFQRWWILKEFGDYQIATLPDSLLMRLLVYSAQVAYSWRRQMTGSQPEQDILDGQQKAALAMAEMLDNPAWGVKDRDPMNLNEPVFMLNIPEERRSQLERAFRATLDSAAHRIDPWVTGFAWQRLRTHSTSPRRRHRLGVYGLVEGPFGGQPGPTDAGRLHTPSYNQTLTALILRDKFLSSTRSALINDSGDNPWAMNISSGRVRLAEEIADEVRQGFHIYEILGRQVEHIIGGHQTVKALRTSATYAMYPERLDPNEVCNGFAALYGLLANDSAFPLTAEQRQALQHLSDALDTYGDLLMADGVMQLVNRQVDRAAETMDAAAGFSRPPTFEFTRTPPSGYHLESVVISVLPFVSVDSLDASASPVRIADASVAAFLDNMPGDDWTWTAINSDDETVLGTVSRAVFGLTPVDTLALSDDFLRELVRRRLNIPLVYIREAENRAWSVSDSGGNLLARITLVELNFTPEEMTALDNVTLHIQIRTAAGAPDNALIDDIPVADTRLWIVNDERGTLLGMASSESLGQTPEALDTLDTPQLHRLVRQTLGLPMVHIKTPRGRYLVQELAAALGSRPAAGRDFTADIAAQAASDAVSFEELRSRYSVLYAAGQQLIIDLRANGNGAQRAGALGRAVLWGIAPLNEAADREALLAALLGLEAPPDVTPLSVLAESVAATLESRLNAAPLPADLPATVIAPLPDHEQHKKMQIPDGIPSLARAIAMLAAPNSKLTILACRSQAVLTGSTGLVIAQTEPALDETWLTVTAAARAPLARLEALQLELAVPLAAWTSAPGDPWQTATVSANLARRSVAVTGFTMPRFTAAYGVSTAWGNEFVAAGLIDAFSEAVPMPQRSTSTAFGFNAPAARAPQAILLAVPPRPRQHLDADLVLQIVEETHELAHARTARIEDLGALQTLTPAMWLQSSPPVRIRLEPGPLYE